MNNDTHMTFSETPRNIVLTDGDIYNENENKNT